MEYSSRKKLRLSDYDYRQPGAYFVTVCTKDKQCLLSTIVGADDHIGPQVRLTPVGRVVEKYLRRIPGVGEYVIMPNHVHMMLYVAARSASDGPMWSSAPTQAGDVGPMWSSAPTQAGDVGPMWSSAPTNRDVSVSVRTWKTLIAKELGIGIWQRSYHDHIIRNEQDLFTRLRYIQENPAKWIEDDYYTQSV